MLRKIKRIIKNPYVIVPRFGGMERLKWIPDKLYLSLCFRANMGYWMNWKKPTTFNEKIQWLKLYNRKAEYVDMVDKVKAKEYVAGKIGDQYIIPTLGVWNCPEEIDFDALPDQFVLKCNHNSGLGMCICTDKSKLNIEEVKEGLRKGLKQNYYVHGREWAYKDVQRKILAEQYMVDNQEERTLKDYKFMCFNGKVMCSFVCSDRYSEDGLKVTFYDREWTKMPFIRHYQNSQELIGKPKKYDEMILLAENLAKDIPFVRVDFYEINEQIYFGELTLYPGCGFEEFTPFSWDEKLGEWIELPKLNDRADG